MAEPKNEAWVLAGYEPRDEPERAALGEVRQQLGFAPNLKPERLTASDHDANAKHSAKKVLERLCADHERKRACWRDTPLSDLEQRGRASGLAAYCDEVRKQIASLWT